MPKVLCPKHEDTNPSVEVYEDVGYCFVCRQSIPFIELGLDSVVPSGPKYIEDLEKKREYIDTLPRREIRGFQFPCSTKGYYILFPESNYFKFRFFDGPEKYKNPSGHSQPLFIAIFRGSSNLFIVEGEINALSISCAYPEADVVSPGSAGEFDSKKQTANLTLYSKYENITIIVDRDAAGTLAAIQLKSFLIKKVPKVSIVLMPVDANDLLLQHGKEYLKEDIEKRRM